LQFVALSSGDLDVEAVDPRAAVAHHVSNCRFLRAAGGMYLQIIDKKPKHVPTPADYKRLGQMLTELGKQTADLGIPLGYHNHMGAMGQGPEAVDRVLDASDPRYVKLELDIAHYYEGGGDPAKAILKYRERLLFLHLKDAKPLASQDTKRDYQFAELGQGNVDLAGVLKALNEIKFRGWAIVELDGPTDGTHTPKQSAEVSKEYLQKAGLSL
jgi:inosose dehydratase